MKSFNSYQEAENWLLDSVVNHPDFVTDTTNEIFGTGFELLNPENNQNNRSNYEYGEAFFRWLLSGEKELSAELLQLNPWVERFVDRTNLPDNFSSSYAWKIKDQWHDIIHELTEHPASRRTYFNILYPQDKVIYYAKTTHEYPCTIGMQVAIREDRLHMIVNMRSQNCYAVMPYDVYNFTRLQKHLAVILNLKIGRYQHQINNAHVYKGDVRRLLKSKK